MRACLMIVLDKVSIEWVFERQQEAVFCLFKEIIDSHDSIFLFEQTVVSLAVRFKSFWVRARKEEKDKLIIDRNVFRCSTWEESIFTENVFDDTRVHSNVFTRELSRICIKRAWLSIKMNFSKWIIEVNYRRIFQSELSKSFSEWIIEEDFLSSLHWLEF
jgi:hypothetical protein